MRGKYPRVVTLIDKNHPSRAGVYTLLGEGPKNYNVKYLREDGSEGWQSLHEKDKYILLEGDHRELERRLLQAERDYNTAREEYDQKQRHALWELEAQWRKDNPPPPYVSPGDVMKTYLEEKDTAKLRELSSRLFVGCFPTGLSYADTATEKDGDYKRLAFLDFHTLTLKFEADCPADFRPLIEADAAEIQRKKFQEYVVSGSGQTVTLGDKL